MIDKKIFLTTLASLFFFTSATFAGANPFADVPASHWAYDSLMKLASEGIVEGYGDGTFLGNRNITRYEMAQMIARALAKNPNQAQKAELDKLSAEFREELDSLGIRIENLEKNSDRLTWTGGIGYEYLHTRNDGGFEDGLGFNDFKIELYPRAEINEQTRSLRRTPTLTTKTKSLTNMKPKFRLKEFLLKEITRILMFNLADFLF